MSIDHATEFEGRAFGPLDLTAAVRSVTIGESVLTDLDCQLRLDESLGIALNLTCPLTQDFENDIRVEFVGGSILDFLQLRSNFDLSTATAHVELTPTLEPMDLPGLPTTRAYGLLVNGPRLTRSINGELKFVTADLSIIVRSFNHSAELFSGRPSKHMPPAITHHLIVESSGVPFDSHRLFKQLGRFASFLGFVKGTRVGLGQLEGEAEQGAAGFRLLGFTKSDRLKAPSNWYYDTMSKELPDLFQSYLAVMTSESGRRNFGRAMNYYKASNAAQSDSTEIALLIGIAGLEALAFHVLHDSGGWSADLIKKATLADMLRATARYLSIHEDPVVHSPPLVGWVKSASRPDFDGFNVLAEFRNGLTHPVANFTYDGPKLLHAWFASQWLLEVLMLAYLDYRGKYQDRRRQLGGRAGDLEDMPIRS